MKQIILGTAGHIDHGKTSLVRALTGINTDRLKEEQLRGITIELGFAYLTLPNGQHLGIVDVPGHEKFVKHMVAGATGIDLVALVIAADEGIMPQTREHMEICVLLGVRYGVVVLTKIDLVEPEWLAMVEEEVAQFTQGTFLEGAPVLPVSSATGQGLPEFTQALERISADIPPRASAGIFRLPVDRVFSMKGFGTVITGTLISGKVAVGEKVMLYPSGLTSKVRGLQVHNQSVETAEAGMRTAINFQGLEKAEVNRGDVIATPEALVPSYMIDVALHYLPSNPKPLKNRSRVRFHAGTSEILGIVALLDREELKPGENAIVQIRLETPVTLIKDDHYVVRSYSPVRTVGGGRVLNPIAPKHKSTQVEAIQRLSALAEAPPEQVVVHHVEAAGYGGCSFGDLMLMANLPEKQLDRLLQTLMSQKTAVQIDREKRRFIHAATFTALQKEMHAHLSAYHGKNPLKQGMPKEELKSRLPASVDIKLFTLTLQQMIKAGEITAEEDLVWLADHRVALRVDQSALRANILSAYENGGLTPPSFKELCETLGTPLEPARQVLSLLVNEGLIVKIREEYYCHQRHLADLKRKLVEYLSTHEEISTPQFKDMTGASRKFVIPLIEYFDTTQLTIRVGDLRKLRKQPTS
ncbi:MAG: selenocysteine-specific translation elongation factor [Desulfobacterales bacterium]|nr:selenocysteine-specific translation elongation factor [Desulfobacterales bacterium]